MSEPAGTPEKVPERPRLSRDFGLLDAGIAWLLRGNVAVPGFGCATLLRLRVSSQISGPARQHQMDSLADYCVMQLPGGR